MLYVNRKGQSSSIGEKILSFVFRQITDDFKEENTEKESVQYRNQFHILLNNNLLFNYLLFKGSKSGTPNKTFLEAWPIRARGGDFGVVNNK